VRMKIKGREKYISFPKTTKFETGLLVWASQSHQWSVC
jgi:hypothetical protein